MLYNIYFSPTGGVKKVAGCLCGAMAPVHSDFDLIRTPTALPAFTVEDVCVISVPAYGGRVPEICAQRIAETNGNGAKAVLVAVFGNRAIDDTLIELYDIVKARGFSVVAAVEAVAEHSLVRVYGSGRPDGDDRRELESFAGIIAEKIRAADLSEPDIPGARPYRDYTPSPMSLVLDLTCTGCKKCALECPAGAIPLTDVSRFDKEKCICCLRCVAVCPVKARHNSPEAEKSLEERLRERCAGRKENRLYI